MDSGNRSISAVTAPGRQSSLIDPQPMGSLAAPLETVEFGRVSSPFPLIGRQPDIALAPEIVPTGPQENNDVVSSSALAPHASPVAVPNALDRKPPLSSGDLAVLLTRGDSLFGAGDLASARLFYERAADASNGQAALRLGETYDPRFLERAHLRGARGDVAAAAFWYKRARYLGMSDAGMLLDSLASK
jgi:TPR repeat protein